MLRAILRNSGLKPRQLLASLHGWRRYQRDRQHFRALDSSQAWSWSREMPMLTEWDDCSGALGAYFFQDQLVARWIHDECPQRHLDVGSRIDGFIGHLSVFREVEVIDIRPQPQQVHNVRFHQIDLMKALPESWLACTDSLSCLHTIEHFGLGRYGDTIDPNGHLRGLEQLKSMVAPGGRLYLSTPVGPQRVEFNAHRVTSPTTLIEWFADGWTIEQCAVIDDEHQVTTSADTECLTKSTCHLGTAIIAARKNHSSPSTSTDPHLQEI